MNSVSASMAASPMQEKVPKKLQVVHIGKFYPPHMGGIETHLEALCGELRRSVDLRVIVASDDNSSSEEVMDGVPLARVATRMNLASTPICPGMVAEIRKCRADIIHLHLPNPMAVLAYLASGHPARLIVSYHSDTVRQRVLGPMFEPVLRMALRRSSAIIASSPNYLRTSPTLAHFQERSHVIPYGIELDEFQHCEPEAVAAIRRQYGERLVVSVGRLVYYKGFEFLIRAMQQVQGTLLIVGEGPLRERLRKLASEVGVAGRVHFLGKLDRKSLIACYHAATAFALASIVRSEAFGIVQIEALAAGTPVVNTDLDSGVPFVSLHEQTGITVPPCDPQALARAINLLMDNPELQQRYGAAARQRACREFSREVMVSRTAALYQQVVSGQSPTN